MLEAYSIKQQRIVKASESDYPDFYGYLLCPSCDDVLFLRKSFLREGVRVSASFIHFAENEITVECKKRVRGSNQKRVAQAKYKSRQQQINKLSLSLWKHLKTNQGVELKYWDKYFEYAMYKKDSFIRITNHLDKISSQLSLDDLWLAYDISVDAVKSFNRDISKWLSSMTLAEYYRQLSISWDLFKLLLFNNNFRELRLRIYSMLLHPEHLKSIGLVREQINTANFSEKVLAYIISSFVLIITTVDWREILEQK